MATEQSRAPVKAGEVVGGKYRIERMLGVGGMGIVMAARHLALDEPVALKFITDERARDRDAIGRMMREARATFRLRSPHTVRVLDVGELPSGPLYIVMEMLEGRDLKAELAARGRLPEREVVQYALEACDALEEAHAMGIVHRDLKPHNMFLSRSTRGATVLKILDFGMSKVDRELFEEGPLTKPATALGTPRYMAPEQWKSAAEVDARADVWALGVVMYELLTGAAPVAELRGAERLARLVAGAIDTPHEKFPEIGEPVSRAVMRCLRADPKVRWPSVRHLATALVDAHPDLDRHVERAEMSHTGVTLVVPKKDAAPRRATPPAGQGAAPAAAPLPDEPRERLPSGTSEAPSTEPAPARPVNRPTMPDTPLARRVAPSNPADFEIPTEVRAPPALATQLAPKPDAAPTRAVTKTLRSAIDRDQIEKLLKSSGVEPTLKMDATKARNLVALAEAAVARQEPPASLGPEGSTDGLTDGPPSAPIELFRVRPPAAPVERWSGRVVVLVVAGGILSVFALLAIGWLVAHSIRH